MITTLLITPDSHPSFADIVVVHPDSAESFILSQLKPNSVKQIKATHPVTINESLSSLSAFILGCYQCLQDQGTLSLVCGQDPSSEFKMIGF